MSNRFFSTDVANITLFCDTGTFSFLESSLF